MFIIFGKKEINETLGRLPEEKCNHCGKEVEKNFINTIEWATLFTSPIFPLTHNSFTTCPSCNAVELVDPAQVDKLKKSIIEEGKEGKDPFVYCENCHKELIETTPKQENIGFNTYTCKDCGHKTEYPLPSYYIFLFLFFALVAILMVIPGIDVGPYGNTKYIFGIAIIFMIITAIRKNISIRRKHPNYKLEERNTKVGGKKDMSQQCVKYGGIIVLSVFVGTFVYIILTS